MVSQCRWEERDYRAEKMRSAERNHKCRDSDEPEAGSREALENGGDGKEGRYEDGPGPSTRAIGHKLVSDETTELP